MQNSHVQLNQSTDLNHSNYDKFPETSVEGFSGYKGWQEIATVIEGEGLKNENNRLITIECYHGVLSEELISGLKVHFKSKVTFIPVQDAMLPPEEVDKMVYPFVTDD